MAAAPAKFPNPQSLSIISMKTVEDAFPISRALNKDLIILS
jgi:hypothetical protein